MLFFILPIHLVIEHWRVSNGYHKQIQGDFLFFAYLSAYRFSRYLSVQTEHHDWVWLSINILECLWLFLSKYIINAMESSWLSVLWMQLNVIECVWMTLSDAECYWIHFTTYSYMQLNLNECHLSWKCWSHAMLDDLLPPSPTNDMSAANMPICWEFLVILHQHVNKSHLWDHAKWHNMLC